MHFTKPVNLQLIFGAFVMMFNLWSNIGSLMTRASLNEMRFNKRLLAPNRYNLVSFLVQSINYIWKLAQRNRTRCTMYVLFVVFIVLLVVGVRATCLHTHLRFTSKTSTFLLCIYAPSIEITMQSDPLHWAGSQNLNYSLI